MEAEGQLPPHIYHAWVMSGGGCEMLRWKLKGSCHLTYVTIGCVGCGVRNVELEAEGQLSPHMLLMRLCRMRYRERKLLGSCHFIRAVVSVACLVCS